MNKIYWVFLFLFRQENLYMIYNVFLFYDIWNAMNQCNQR